MVKFGKRIHSVLDSASIYNSLAYDVLKKAIDVVVSEGAQATDQAAVSSVNAALGHPGGLTSTLKPPDSRFHGLLQHELAKVNKFANLQLQALLDTLREAQRIVTAPTADEATVVELERLLDSAGEQVIAYEQFKRLNFTGFRKIVKKFDKRCRETGTAKGSLGGWFLPMLLREPFASESLDAHLLALSAGYAALRYYRRGGRSPGTGRPAAVAAVAAPPGESTSTFWVSPPERLRALCALIKRFEIVGPPGPAAEAPHGDRMRRALQTLGPNGRARLPCQLRAESLMVFYDGPDYREYMDRLEEDRPRGFRVRQTVPSQGPPGSELVERDGAPSALGVHAFTPVRALQAADAFPLRPHGMEASGGSGEEHQVLVEAARAAARCREAEALSAQDREQLAAFAGRVEQTVEAASANGVPLWAVATVRASRVLLRGDTPNTEGITIAFDEDVQFARGAVGAGTSSWSDALYFPYNLLEVASGRVAGSWLEELKGTASLQTIQGFSVGAHAVAALYKDSLPKLPGWYKHLNNAESWGPLELWGMRHEWRQAVAEEEGDDQAIAAAASIRAVQTTRTTREAPMSKKATMVAASAGAPPPTPASAQETPPLEPKSLMASERTMLEWIHTVLALATIGIGLWKYSLTLPGEDGRPEATVALGLLNGATLASFFLGCYSLALVTIAVAFAWYAVLSHTRRLTAIQANRFKERIFNSKRGPVTFATMVGLALFMHVCVQAVPLWDALAGDDLGGFLAGQER